MYHTSEVKPDNKGSQNIFRKGLIILHTEKEYISFHVMATQTNISKLPSYKTIFVNICVIH